MIEAGENTGTVIAFHDITERKKMEDEIKTSLKEKELLLKEIHHRVKNNLQIISSLLSLQSEYVNISRDKLGDKLEMADVFKDSQSRIRSMVIVHERLYKSKDISNINFAEYIRDLTDNLFLSYKESAADISLKINADNIDFDIDTAIPLGLLINELISNSLKYAFPDNRRGEILIALQQYSGMGHGGYALTVCDNGIGLPEGFDFRNTKSLGLQLVNTLAGQLNGAIEVKGKNGTEFKMTFTPPPRKNRAGEYAGTV
ncbi:MAG: hypothetical protein A2073_00095 [Deltaproteobacteria bacterium GWC2_42_11]|nr:MAG: hypothetical protein A2073_00095 [Deltaproteobacteria bacterium GWC2_42_11]